MEERIRSEVQGEEQGLLWTSAFVLMGLSYPEGLIRQLLRGVTSMEDSVTYQAIIGEGRAKGKAEGKAEEARVILLRQGKRKFGRPDRGTSQPLKAIQDLERLERLLDRILEASSWRDLLSSP